jgi:hypothetical protein
MLNNVVELFPDENPHGSRLMADLNKVVNDHLTRGELSYSAVMGAMLVTILRTYDDAKASECL